MTTLGMSGGRRLAAAAAVIATAGAGCGSAARSPAMPPHVLTGAQVGTLRAYSAGDTAFGLAVLSAVCTRQPGANVVLSPVSLATGLGMALLGAPDGRCCARSTGRG